jgi:hypothetical protein
MLRRATNPWQSQLAAKNQATMKVHDTKRVVAMAASRYGGSDAGELVKVAVGDRCNES